MRQFWRYARGLAMPLVLWGLFVGILADALRSRLRGNEEYDEAALREWIEESRTFRESLPEMVRGYLESAEAEQRRFEQFTKDASKKWKPSEQLTTHAQQIREQLDALGTPARMYQGQLPLFPSIYRLELEFPQYPSLSPIDWESGAPRQVGQVRRLTHSLLGPADDRALLHLEYQLHAYDKRQRDEQAANQRLRWIGGLAVSATALAFLWIVLVQRKERERERQSLLAQQHIAEAERLLLEEELRRREVERRHEETERQLLEQQLATQEAERRTLEMKSQMYAGIGIMAGSYAHNIKNLLVRPNDLLARCLEADGLTSGQDQMLREVRRTLGTVTERLQQILQTVRRDPQRSVLGRLDLNAMIREIHHTWEDLAREKWKLKLSAEVSAELLWIEGDLSHLQQAIENLLFNARDATFEMRKALREQARRALDAADAEGRADLRQAVIDAAAWRGDVVLRTRRDGDRVILEVRDNGIGMTEEVRRRCTEPHFSTKRDNALYEGHSTGMGLGLSFVAVVLDNHHAELEIESEPQRGTLFRMKFPWRGETPKI